MLIASLTFDVRSETRVELVSAVTQVLDTMRWAAGCLGCRLFADCENPNLFMLTSEWDNRAYRIDGALAWSAVHGQTSVPVESFKASVTNFHERFVAAMQDRVSDVTSHWSRPEVRLDPASLRETQRLYEGLLASALALPPRKTIPWDVAIACLRENVGAR